MTISPITSAPEEGMVDTSFEVKENGLSYLYRLQMLVSRMTDQLSRLSERSHESAAMKKREYRVSSSAQANLTEKAGNLAPVGPAISFALFTGALFISGDTPLKTSLSFFAEKGILDAGMNVYTSHLNAEGILQQSRATERLNDIQTEGTKSQDGVSIATALSELSRALLDTLRKASS